MVSGPLVVTKYSFVLLAIHFRIIMLGGQADVVWARLFSFSEHVYLGLHAYDIIMRCNSSMKTKKKTAQDSQLALKFLENDAITSPPPRPSPTPTYPPHPYLPAPPPSRYNQKLPRISDHQLQQ